jgi:hypothetical protein
MKTIYKTLALSCLALALVGCESSTDQVDAGGVILSISDFDGLPIVISVNGSGGIAQIESMTIESISKNPTGPTGPLMNVEMQSFEFTYTREDTGSRVPPKLVHAGFGVVPINGTMTVDNQPFMVFDQFNSQPLKDLGDLGIDTQTGSSVVRMRVTMRAFGRTLSGDSVVSAPASFTVEFVQ